MPQAVVYAADSRSLQELEDGNVHLVVTSPPYWHIKDYGVKKQIGFGQTLHKYLKDLYLTWKECFRVLKPGRRLCINIGDQFTRARDYGKYKIIPLHAEFISQCEDIGFDYMGSIIWQKRTTMKTSGGANIMGSYPYPPNGMVEFDYEYILIFKKPGKSIRIDKKLKDASKLTKTDWKQYFSGHWKFGGARQVGHEAMFPDELPKRLIKMFCFKNETVLDPFVGSGTTLKATKGLDRDGIGYEINPEFIKMIERKVGKASVEFQDRKGRIKLAKIDYKPSIQNISPLKKAPQKRGPGDTNKTFKVTDIVNPHVIALDDGRKIGLLGIRVVKPMLALEYLNQRVLKREVILKFDKDEDEAYIYLKNKIFINQYMIKSGLARADKYKDHKLRKKFVELDP